MKNAFVWEDCFDDLREGVYLAYVWSPYAIPHAVGLEHDYHRRARWSSIEFQTVWRYTLVDFEDDTSTRPWNFKDFILMCSNRYDNEELRADIINTGKLTMTTVNRIRTFLYGSRAQACKDLTCSDATLMELIFASMG